MEFAPFTAVGDLVYVRKSWWNKLPVTQRLRIVSSYGNYYGYAVREDFEKNEYEQDYESFWAFHQAYISSYAINNWHSCLDCDYLFCKIDEKTLEGLEKLAKLCMYRPRKLKEDDIEFCDVIFRLKIEQFLERHKVNGVFMKLTDCSGKHSRKLTPKFSLLQIIEEIVNNKDLIQNLLRYKQRSCVFLTPWNCNITKANEFRVIIINGVVTGISQQQCYKYVGLSKETIKKHAESILALYERKRKNIPYHSCVLDVWVSSGDKAYLIEINPGEMWGPSGSALFNWKVDKDKLYQTEKTYVRFVDNNEHADSIESILNSVF